MLHSPTTCTTNLTNVSDLRGMYQAAVARGERLPLSFAVGSHPADFMAAVLTAAGRRVRPCWPRCAAVRRPS